MTDQKIEINFILTILVVTAVLTFFIFQPYLYAIVTAAAFASVFYSTYNYINKKVKSNNLAAAATTLIIVAIILIPLGFIGFQIVGQANNLYQQLAASNNTSGIHQTVDAIQLIIKKIIPNFNIDLDTYLENTLTFFIGRFGGIFTATMTVSVNVFIAMMACFYLLKNNTLLKKEIQELLPIRNSYIQKITDELRQAIVSIVRGSILIAVIQGFLIGFGFYLFNIDNALLWGSTAVIAALIPVVGTALVGIPGVIYLIVTNQIMAAVGLFIWSVGLVGLIDNLIRPIIIGRGSNIHSFLVLLSIIGGISFFGPLGLILGPLTLSLLFALMSTYTDIHKENLS